MILKFRALMFFFFIGHLMGIGIAFFISLHNIPNVKYFKIKCLLLLIIINFIS